MLTRPHVSTPRPGQGHITVKLCCMFVNLLMRGGLQVAAMHQLFSHDLQCSHER